MTNVELLRAKIEQSGKKKGYLAEKCGLSYAAFNRRVSGAVEFTSSEIQALCVELGITDWAEKEAIFFAAQVAKTATSKE